MEDNMELNEALDILEDAGFVAEEKQKYDISVFSKVKIHGAKVVVNDDSVEINGQAFKFKIDTDLRYELQVLIRRFGNWYKTNGKFKETVLEKKPEQLKNLILSKSKDYKWRLTSFV